ncbi:MAG: AtpZ/AtpI family protein [Bacillota bacterium]
MDNHKWNQILQALSLLSQVGILMLANIGLGFAGGYFLDVYLGRDFLFKALGLLVGISSGFYSNYKLITKIFDD